MGALAAACAVLGLALSPAAGTSGSGLTIADVSTDRHPQVDITIDVTGDVDFSTLADEIVVTENGTPIDVVAVAPATEAGMEVMLVIDGSGSMSGEPIDAARAAAHAFVDELPDGVRVGVVGFGSLPALLQAPTANTAKVHAAIDELGATGETALYDAVRFGAQQFSDDAAVRRMLLVSDGGDTVSFATLGDAVRSTRRVTVDAIELVTNESNRANLDGLTDGDVRSVSDPALLSDLYGDVAASFARQVVVTATSSAHGETTLGVSLDIADSTLTAEETVVMPDLPPAPVTVPPSTQVNVPASEPSPASSVAPAPVSADDARSGQRFIGAAAIVLALFVLVMTLRSGPSRRSVMRDRLRSGLGTQHEEARRPSLLDVVDGALLRRGWLDSIEYSLRQAGMTTAAGELVLTTAVGALVVASVLGVTVHPLLGVLGLVLVPFAVRAVVRHKIASRRSKFVDQLPDVLQLIQSMLASGFGLLQALKATSEQVAEPARSCFAQAMFAARSGRDISEALRDVADEMQSPDFDWVVTAIEINRDIGGDLSTLLGSVAEGVRERQRLRGQVKALTAEGRLSAYVMLALPPGVLAVSAFSNPDYVSRLFTGAGIILLVVAIVLMAVGYFWMRRMINKVMA